MSKRNLIFILLFMVMAKSYAQPGGKLKFISPAEAWPDQNGNHSGTWRGSACLDLSNPKARDSLKKAARFFTKKYDARHVKNLDLDNIRVQYANEDKRPPIVCVDIDGLEISNFKAAVAKGVEAGIFQKVRKMNIYYSPVLDKVSKEWIVT